MVNEVLLVISGILCLLFSINYIFIVPKKLKSSSKLTEELKTRKTNLSLGLGLLLISLGFLLILIYIIQSVI